jgi:hypothetical protein
MKLEMIRTNLVHRVGEGVGDWLQNVMFLNNIIFFENIKRISMEKHF